MNEFALECHWEVTSKHPHDDCTSLQPRHYHVIKILTLTDMSCSGKKQNTEKGKTFFAQIVASHNCSCFAKIMYIEKELGLNLPSSVQS
jgi:hypothetical protein